MELKVYVHYPDNDLAGSREFTGDVPRHSHVHRGAVPGVPGVHGALDDLRGETKSLTFEPLSRFGLHGKAEVGEFDVHPVVQQDVLGLQVPVDDVLAVQELDHLHQRTHDVPKDNKTKKPDRNQDNSSRLLSL
ncbi:hypothetical protein EYF80_014325 [Liparis tanakae]|uniref:Uncharacterized protein n=1 Tax=Liparis tanakae TaxID=230148 RepID=A0A4Z2IEN1_9TELE|nr:hypothetical protein EYF80_014325 [Liparis tanakae]